MALSPSEKIFLKKLKDSGYSEAQLMESLKKQRAKKSESFIGRANLATQDVSPEIAAKGEAVTQATQDLNAAPTRDPSKATGIIGTAMDVAQGGLLQAGVKALAQPYVDNVAKDTSEMITGGGEQVVSGLKDIGQSFGADTLAEGVTQASGGASKIIGGGLQTAFAAPAAALTNVPLVGGLAESGLEYLSEGVDYVAKGIGDTLGVDEEGKDVIRQHVNNLVMLLGAKYGPEASTKLIDTLKSSSGKIVEGIKTEFPNLPSKLKDVGTGEFAQKLIASADKIDPTKTVEFEKMTTVKPGQWLQERGIIAAPSEAVPQLVEYWKSSKDAVDTTLAKVNGRFKDKSVKNILDEQVKYFTETGDRANLNITKKRLQTLDSEGLTLPEINSVKRLYESTEKLGYAKDLNSVKVARSTNLDSAIRDFLIDTAESRGFKNIRALNKETQAAKFLADEIYRKMQKQEANNVLGLTDQIMAMGGIIDPSMWAALGIKKILLGGTGKAYLAKLLSPEATKGIPQPTSKLVELKSKQKQAQDLATSSNKQTTANPIIENTNPITETLPPKGNFNKAGTAESATIFRGGTAEGKYFSTSKTVASDFANNRGGSVSEYTLSPNAKIINYEDIPTAQYKGINDYNMESYGSGKDLLSFQNGKLEADYTKAETWARDNGYDVVKFPTEGEIRVINSNVALPKTETGVQLGEPKTNMDTLIKEAKKYKTADEFVDSKIGSFASRNDNIILQRHGLSEKSTKQEFNNAIRKEQDRLTEEYGTIMPEQSLLGRDGRNDLPDLENLRDKIVSGKFIPQTRSELTDIWKKANSK